MSIINKITVGTTNYNIADSAYYTCDTAAGTANKSISGLSTAEIVDGLSIKVKFTNSNTASNPKLYVGSTGYSIYKYGTTAAGTTENTSWFAGEVVEFTFITSGSTFAAMITGGKPTIPTVNNATLTIQKNGTTVKTFTANASSNVTANITVPTKTSELTNDSGFLKTYYNQTVIGSGNTFGAGDAIDIVGSGAVTVTADTTNKKITISAPNVTDTNQKIKAGSVTFGDNDVVDIVAGSNVTVTGASTGTGAPKITISATVPTKTSDLTNDRFVRYDTNAQGLTDTQKSNARTNIGAGTSNLTIGTTSTTAAAGNHAHGNITNSGTITSTAVTSATGVLVYDSENKIQRATAEQTRSIIGAGTGDYNDLTNKPITGYTSLKPRKAYIKDWSTKSWDGRTTFTGRYIWTDGDNIYCSMGEGDQWILNKTTSTWERKAWKVLTGFDGNDVWTDGNNIYFSQGTLQYVLNKATSTWETKTWSGLTSFHGRRIWTDGNNIYFSNSTSQYVLNKTTSTWGTKTWSGLTSFDGANIWTDGNNIYCSKGATHYILNKVTSTWQTKTWSGLTSFDGEQLWTDGDNVYYSYSSSHYILNKATSTWETKTWSGFIGFAAQDVWTDGNNIYYSNNTNQYVLNKTYSNIVPIITYDNKSAVASGTDVSLVTTGEKYTWDNKSDLTLGNTSTTAAAGDHTHGNITNSGTITSTAVTSATGVLVYDSNNTIQRATAANARTIIGAGTSNLTIGTTASTAAAGNHTHTISLATDTGTSTVDLAADTKYKLTAGGSSIVFKTPAGGSSLATEDVHSW